MNFPIYLKLTAELCINVENRRGLIGSSLNRKSFIYLVWDIRTYNFRDILHINEVLSKISQNYDRLSPVIYRYVSFYMSYLNNNDNQNTNYKKEMHYNLSLSIIGKRDIGFQFRGELLDLGTWEDYIEPDDQGQGRI